MSRLPDQPETQPAHAPQALTWAGLALFLVTAAFIVVKTGRDALYIQGDGLLGIPKAYIATAILSIPQAMAMLALLRRLGPRRTRILTLLAVLALVCAYAVSAHPGAGALMTLFFFMVPLLFSVVFSVIWLLGSSVLDGAERAVAAKAFSRLGAASIVGGFSGGTLARGVGPLIGPTGLLWCGAGLLVATLVAVSMAHARSTAAVAPPSRKPQTSWRAVAEPLSQRSVRLLLGISMTAAMAGIFVDFQFYLAAVARSPGDHTVYFANVYLVLSGASLALQLLVAPRLQQRVGVEHSLLVLPVALFGGAALVLLSGTLLARTGLRVLEGGLKSGVHRTSWEQAYLQLPRTQRASAKVLVDGLGARLAEGAAGLILHLWLLWSTGGVVSALKAGWVAAVSASWVTLALLVVAIAWVSLSYTLGKRLPATELDDGEDLMVVRAPLPDS